MIRFNGFSKCAGILGAIAIVFACASPLSAGSSGSFRGRSLFLDAYAFHFMSVREAFSAYEGIWGGRQELFSNGRKIGDGVVQQQYVRDRLNPGTLAGLAKVSLTDGRSALTRSSMRTDGGGLRLEVRGENNSVDTYIGVFDRNTVTWIQYPMVKNLDVQTDSFGATPNGAVLVSRGFRKVASKDGTFSGFILSGTVLKRESIFPRSVEKTGIPNAEKLFRTPNNGAFGN